ncbi:MAG: UDP-N-acetylmuramate:L-alanyl-gamma-D-glutamyl-meso-diaminopimelate ligase, partial [Piscirickettsiaceae bacterium]
WALNLDEYPAIHVISNIDEMIDKVVLMAEVNDHLLFMSNGGFGGIHEKVEALLTN